MLQLVIPLPRPAPRLVLRKAWSDEARAAALEARRAKAHTQLQEAESKKGHWGASSPASVDEHLEKAPANQGKLSSDIKEIATAVDHGMEAIDPGHKTRDSLQRKVDTGRKPAEVSDAVRTALIAPTPELGEKAMDELKKKYDTADEGWQTTEAGYFDRKAIVRFRDGQMGEVQMWPPGMREAREKGHILYDKAKKLPKNDLRRKELNEEMKALYGGVAHQLGDTWAEVTEM